MLLLQLAQQPLQARDNEYYYTELAGTLIGEGGRLDDDFETMSCTIKNRLDRGWALAKVKNAYHAKYYKPTQEHIDVLKQIIFADKSTLSAECQVVYFFFTTAYARRFNQNVKPILRLGGHLYFKYEDYKHL